MASSSDKPEPSPDGSIRNCPICMDPVQGEEQKFLSCAHVFHEPCINRWLADKTTCPVCRNQELKPPPAPTWAGSQWHHIMPMVNLRGIATATLVTNDVLPSAIRPRQQSVHGRRRARRRGVETGPSRSRSRGARSRSRAPSSSTASNNEPSRDNGHDLV